MNPETYFTPQTFRFLRDLAANNRREWFVDQKDRYEHEVREPALRFIADFAPRLRRISPHFHADARKVGGSLFRIHRDTRFAKDKRPYKTFTGIQFRHKAGRDAHAPGFYLHLEPGQVFMGVGSWHPDSDALRSIRAALLDNGAAWKRAIGSASFRKTFTLEGESLTRPPRGVDGSHPLIADLKRKDFIGVATLTQAAVAQPAFIEEFTRLATDGSPLVRFLAKALGLPF